MIIVFSHEARLDLLGIFDYILEDNPLAAAKTLESIKTHIQNLQKMPYLGRPGRVPGTRELVIPGTPFVVPYQVENNRLAILRVYHSARNWPKK